MWKSAVRYVTAPFLWLFNFISKPLGKTTTAYGCGVDLDELDFIEWIISLEEETNCEINEERAASIQDALENQRVEAAQKIILELVGKSKKREVKQIVELRIKEWLLEHPTNLRLTQHVHLYSSQINLT